MASIFLIFASLMVFASCSSSSHPIYKMLLIEAIQPYSVLESNGVHCNYSYEHTCHVFRCQVWHDPQPDYVLTRAAMKNAVVYNHPEIPFLANATTMSDLSFIIIENNREPRTFINHIEEGFLSDYPLLEALRIQNVSVSELKQGVLNGLHLMAIFIEPCQNLKKIEKGFFQTHVRQLIQIVDTALTELDAESFYGLDDLKYLVIAHSSIRRIDGLFRDLARLERLDLTCNEIDYIDTILFQNLTNLTYLSLWSNPIKDVPQNMLLSFSALEKFYVGSLPTSDSHLRVMNQSLVTKTKLIEMELTGVFDLNPGLSGVNTEALVIDYGNVTTLPNLAGIVSVDAILFLECNIKFIEYNAFHSKGLLNLNRLNLKGNNIETIQRGTLDFLPNLRWLSIQNNSISRIDKYYFENLSSLRKLYLDDNKITEIENGTFWHLSHIEIVGLSHNNLRALPNISLKGDIFHDIVFDLSCNEISDVTTEFFKGFSLGPGQTVSLLLRGNKIRSVQPIPDEASIYNLDLSNNLISNITFPAITAQNLIAIIDLSNNNIFQIDNYAFYYIYKLRELILHHNFLKEVKFVSYLPSSVSLIDLRYNKLSIIMDDVRNALKSIRHYEISDNPWICDCSATYRTLIKFLLENKIVSCCPKGCEYSVGITGEVDINCHAKTKMTLPPCLPYHHVNLNYSHNFLKSLRFSKDQKNIRNLDVSKNAISKIDGSSFRELSNLSILNLDTNYLRSIPKEMAQLRATKIK